METLFDIITNPKDRVFHFGRNCWLIYVGNDPTDREVFVRIGISPEYEMIYRNPNYNPIVEKVIVLHPQDTDNLLIEQFISDDTVLRKFYGHKEFTSKILDIIKTFDKNISSIHNASDEALPPNSTLIPTVLAEFTDERNVEITIKNDKVFSLKDEISTNNDFLLEINDVLSHLYSDEKKFSGFGFRLIKNSLENVYNFHSAIIFCNNSYTLLNPPFDIYRILAKNGLNGDKIFNFIIDENSIPKSLGIYCKVKRAVNIDTEPTENKIKILAPNLISHSLESLFEYLYGKEVLEKHLEFLIFSNANEIKDDDLLVKVDSTSDKELNIKACSVDDNKLRILFIQDHINEFILGQERSNDRLFPIQTSSNFSDAGFGNYPVIVKFSPFTETQIDTILKKNRIGLCYYPIPEQLSLPTSIYLLRKEITYTVEQASNTKLESFLIFLKTGNYSKDFADNVSEAYQSLGYWLLADKKHRILWTQAFLAKLNKIPIPDTTSGKKVSLYNQLALENILEALRFLYDESIPEFSDSDGKNLLQDLMREVNSLRNKISSNFDNDEFLKTDISVKIILTEEGRAYKINDCVDISNIKVSVSPQSKKIKEIINLNPNYNLAFRNLFSLDEEDFKKCEEEYNKLIKLLSNIITEASSIDEKKEIEDKILLYSAQLENIRRKFHKVLDDRKRFNNLLNWLALNNATQDTKKTDEKAELNKEVVSMLDEILTSSKPHTPITTTEEITIEQNDDTKTISEIAIEKEETQEGTEKTSLESTEDKSKEVPVAVEEASNQAEIKINFESKFDEVTKDFVLPKEYQEEQKEKSIQGGKQMTQNTITTNYHRRRKRAPVPLFIMCGVIAIAILLFLGFLLKNYIKENGLSFLKNKDSDNKSLTKKDTLSVAVNMNLPPKPTYIKISPQLLKLTNYYGLWRLGEELGIEKTRMKEFIEDVGKLNNVNPADNIYITRWNTVRYVKNVDGIGYDFIDADSLIISDEIMRKYSIDEKKLSK